MSCGSGWADRPKELIGMSKRSFYYDLDRALYDWAIDPPEGWLVRLIRRFFAFLRGRGQDNG